MQATAAIVLLLMSGVAQPGLGQQPSPPAQQTSPAGATTPAAPASATQPAAQAPTGQDQAVPPTPQPRLTQPLYLRSTGHDYTHPHGAFPNPFTMYSPANYPAARLGNTPRLDQLVRDGKIYLSLSDAVLLALENNFDIAIARINLDIADTDILRARAGATLRGVSTGLVSGTLGGVGTAVTGGGGAKL